jgi:ABC-type dipeptide/oligopeptide/nickel transport system permease subunit
MTEPSIPVRVEAPVPPVTGAAGGLVAPPTDVGDSGSAAAEGLELVARSQWSYARRRFLRHRLAMIGLVGLVVIFGAGALANWVAPYTFDQIDLTNVLHAPTTNANHFFGTDEIGRDYLSRVIYGIRTSEQVGLVVALVSTVFGVIVGAIAGFFRGWLDNLIMRVTDLILTIPLLVTLLTVSALLARGGSGGGKWTITFIIAAFYWTVVARIVRGTFLSLREKEYVEAARAVGAGDMRIMFRHMLPNTLGPIVVAGTLAVADAIITEAFLSFLGFGIKPPTPSLGALLADAQSNPQKWWLTIMPGLVLVAIVICVNFVGDGLRDALDPQQRRVRA